MEMEKRGWEYTITRTSLAAADVSTQCLEMRNLDCDYIYLLATEHVTIVWLKELDRQNFHPVVFGSSNIGSPETWRATGELCVGTLGYNFSPGWPDTDLPLVSLAHELNAKWHPDVTMRTSHYIKGFANMLVAAEALERTIEKVGYDNLNGASMKETMEAIRDFDPGIGIGYTWTPNDHRGVRGLRFFKRMPDGSLKSETGWITCETLPEEQRTDAFWIQD